MFQGPANDSRVFTFAGTSFRANGAAQVIPDMSGSDEPYADQYPLWSVDNSTQTWDQFDIQQTFTPSYGAAAEAPDQGLAFYLNGQLDNASSTHTTTLGNSTTYLDGMLAIDLVRQTSRNLSTSGIRDYLPRVGGSMQYIPGVGKNGVLVTLGGKVDDQSRTSSPTSGRLVRHFFFLFASIWLYRSLRP